jgi:hypothetical protein
LAEAAELLALEQAGAVRFVNILEWAERVARTWRKVGGIGVRELAECDQEDFGTFTLRQNFSGKSTSCTILRIPFIPVSVLNFSITRPALDVFTMQFSLLSKSDLPEPESASLTPYNV